MLFLLLLPLEKSVLHRRRQKFDFLMDFKENSKSKRSIFNQILSKRSTKVEPQPSFHDQNDDAHHSSTENHPYHQLSSAHEQNPFQTSASASSTPIKRLHIGRLNRLWHCHSSTQSLTSNHSAPSNFIRKISTSTKKKIRNTNDRHSHPISNINALPKTHVYDGYYLQTNCIEADPTDRNCVQFHSNGGANVPRSISTERICGNNSGGCGGAGFVMSKSQEQIIVNDIDEIIVCDSSKQQSPTSKSHDGNFTYNREDSDFPDSIAMSACRSRLRERLLPPGYAKQASHSSTEQQHYSFPNIVDKNSRPSSEQHRNSRSISCDLASNAKSSHRSGRTESLAKNSLMAAQLINLIPTEVARERYTQTP